MTTSHSYQHEISINSIIHIVNLEVMKSNKKSGRDQIGNDKSQ